MLKNAIVLWYRYMHFWASLVSSNAILLRPVCSVQYSIVGACIAYGRSTSRAERKGNFCPPAQYNDNFVHVFPNIKVQWMRSVIRNILWTFKFVLTFDWERLNYYFGYNSHVMMPTEWRWVIIPFQLLRLWSYLSKVFFRRNPIYPLWSNCFLRRKLL
jgi:hypothetical protein